MEPDVIPHLPEPILLENVEKMAILYDKYFSKADEPELEARSYALWAVAYEAVEDLTVTAAIHLADACDHYGYKPPF